jgi:hypothetical protein
MTREIGMKVIQIVPRKAMRLYDDLLDKEEAIRERGRGTFFRAGRKKRSGVTWKHKAYRGSVKLERGSSDDVTAKIRAQPPESEWQMLSAFLGFVDRHFGPKISAINVNYR